MTKVIQRQEVTSIDDCVVSVVTIDEMGVLSWLDETPIPTPELIHTAVDIDGPHLTIGSKGLDTKDLQRLLVGTGWYTGKLDSEFGPKMESALKLFQSFHGLRSDGIAGPVSKALLTQARYDSVPDMHEDHSSGSLDLSSNSTSTVSYWVGICPGYLNRDAVLKEISEAFDSWHQVSGIDFNLVEKELAADLKIQFVDDINDDATDLLAGGGDLGRVGKNFVHIDTTKRWVLHSAEDASNSSRGYKFKPAILHLVGHSLGFDHVANKSSVMYPIYDPAKTDLNAVDRALLCSRGSC